MWYCGLCVSRIWADMTLAIWIGGLESHILTYNQDITKYKNRNGPRDETAWKDTCKMQMDDPLNINEALTMQNRDLIIWRTVCEVDTAEMEAFWIHFNLTRFTHFTSIFNSTHRLFRRKWIYCILKPGCPKNKRSLLGITVQAKKKKLHLCVFDQSGCGNFSGQL